MQVPSRRRQRERKGKILTHPALMNINCNKQASDFYNHPNKKTRAFIISPNEMKVYFKSGGTINPGKLFNQILRDRHSPVLWQYIEKKYKWGPQQFNKINLITIKIAHSANTFNQKVWISKAIYEWYPTIDRLHKITPEDNPSPMCNICKTMKETQDCIFCCNHPTSRTTQITALKT